MAVNEKSNANGWLVVLARFIISFIFVGFQKSYGVLITRLVEDFGASEGLIGLCGSLYGGLPHIAGFFCSSLISKYGVRAVIMVGGAVSSIAIFTAVFAANVPHLAISLSIAGFANGFCGIPSIIALTWYFQENFALANGISTCGGAFGMMIMPPITELLVETYGWRGTMLLLSGFSFNCVVAGACIRSKNKEYEQVLTKEKSEDGQEIDATETSERICSFLHGEIFLEIPQFTLYQAAISLFATAWAAWMLFLVPDGISKGFSPRKSALLSTMGGIGTIIGRVAHSPFIDLQILSTENLFVLLCLSCAISFFMDPFVNSYAVLSISSFNVGLTTGALYPMALVLTKEIVEDQKRLIPAIAWMQCLFGVAKVAGGPLAGYLFDATESFTAAFLTMGGIILTSAFLLLGTKIIRVCGMA